MRDKLALAFFIYNFSKIVPSKTKINKSCILYFQGLSEKKFITINFQIILVMGKEILFSYTFGGNFHFINETKVVLNTYNQNGL